MGNTESICQNCRHYFGDTCRRFPPTPVMNLLYNSIIEQNYTVMDCHFPNVEKTDFCGEFLLA